jgi:prolipoprotein diacylglyceryltransferase
MIAHKTLSHKSERVTKRLTSPWISLCRRRICAYQFFGFAGLTLAAALTSSLAYYRGLSPFVLAAILGAGVAIFFVLILARVAVTGEERITYYHHELAVLAGGALLLKFLGEPLLPYLDLTVLGIGVFLMLGRVGCFRMGCCHGRPHPRGVRYRQEHAETGFSCEYVGVPLFPIQLVESGWVLSIVVAGTAMVLAGWPDGAALSFYAVAYGIGRFGFEFLRGDAGRRYQWGFSEAQWFSVAILIGFVAAEAFGALPVSPWHAGAAVMISLTMIAVAVKRAVDKNGLHYLLTARHIGELAEGLGRIEEVAAALPRQTPVNPSRVAIARTSLGIQVSFGTAQSLDSLVNYYTISRRGESMSLKSAQAVANLIRSLRRSDEPCRIVEGTHGIFHVLLSPVSPGLRELR